MQQLDHLVERGRVGLAGGDDREQPLEITGQQVALQQRLPGPHPVAVAHHGVDLAVVRDHPERVRQLPGRERVGGETGVDDRQRAGQPLVVQFGEDQLELLGGQHPLVDQGPAGQRGEIDADLVLHPAAQAVRQPLERDAHHRRRPGGHEQLLEPRHGGPGHVAERARVGRHRPPAQDGQALLLGQQLDLGPGLGRVLVVDREEDVSDRVTARPGQVEAGLGPQESVRDLDQDAGAVTGAGIGAGRAAVIEVAQRLQALLDDGVAGLAGQGRDERDATGVVLEPGVVETLGGPSQPGRRCGR